MSIFIKIFILLILFVSLNIVSIYTFSYEDYFTNKKEDIELKDKKGIFKFFSEDFFKKAGYKPSEFVISKNNNLLFLSGTFSSNEVAKQVLDFLKINDTQNINILENSEVSKDLLRQISELTELLKDNFENGSKISFDGNKLLLEGELKDNNHKDLITTVISKINKYEIQTNIYEKKDNLIDLNIDNVTKNENFDEIDKNNEQKDKILSKNDVQSSVNNIFITDKISFERRSVEPTEKSKILIEKVSNILKENTNFNIEIAGHTDSRGNKELNKKISQDRANRVKEILESFGIYKERIKAVGYGNERPIAQDDENGLSEINRRVEFIIGD
ncbi:hypothetical protein CJ671_03480 [Aliarcobacter cryaerophilus]|uniref:OmpA-like domain-containing protein n=1 Tax=Aliarcobacter cryaerophilus TaxID=28198 RepID=A0A2S9SUA6_9BACT|nr:OmpA family protein [Aliarcobacter cryaerophilus]PRM90186.1 hypothetical protein CJ671_03480 [Aliarcobacter cryaerophilus]